MKRMVLLGGAVALSSLLAIACGGSEGGAVEADAGVDANITVAVDPVISVSGTAEIFPVAAGWMADAGMTVPTLEGMTLQIEEPLKVALGDPTGSFGSAELDDSGSFSVSGVDTAGVVLGIGGGVVDAADAGTLVRSTTTIHDTALHSGKPTVDLHGAQVFALPRAFHDRLTEAISPVTVSGLTDGGATTLRGAGFVLGQVVDAEGKPVVGAKLVTGTNGGDSRIFYPTDDFGGSSQTSGTGSHGLFVYVHDGAPTPESFTLRVDGASDYLARNAAAAPGTGLILMVYPGTTPP